MCLLLGIKGFTQSSFFIAPLPSGFSFIGSYLACGGF